MGAENDNTANDDKIVRRVELLSGLRNALSEIGGIDPDFGIHDGKIHREADGRIDQDAAKKALAKSGGYQFYVFDEGGQNKVGIMYLGGAGQLLIKERPYDFAKYSDKVEIAYEHEFHNAVEIANRRVMRTELMAGLQSTLSKIEGINPDFTIHNGKIHRDADGRIDVDAAKEALAKSGGYQIYKFDEGGQNKVGIMYLGGAGQLLIKERPYDFAKNSDKIEIAYEHEFHNAVEIANRRVMRTELIAGLQSTLSKIEGINPDFTIHNGKIHRDADGRFDVDAAKEALAKSGGYQIYKFDEGGQNKVGIMYLGGAGQLLIKERPYDFAKYSDKVEIAYEHEFSNAVDIATRAHARRSASATTNPEPVQAQSQQVPHSPQPVQQSSAAVEREKIVDAKIKDIKEILSGIATGIADMKKHDVDGNINDSNESLKSVYKQINEAEKSIKGLTGRAGVDEDTIKQLKSDVSKSKTEYGNAVAAAHEKYKDQEPEPTAPRMGRT